jgi:hypothetical protein
MGRHIAHLVAVSPRALRWHALPFLLFGILLAALAPQITRFANPNVPVEILLWQKFVPWVIAAGLALALGSAWAWVQASRGHADRAMLGFAFGGLLFSQIAITGADTLSPVNSGWHIAQAIRPHLTPDVPFYSVGMYEQTLPPYLKRTVQLVAYEDELAFGISVEPEKFIPTLAEFEQRWRATNGQAFALMPPHTYAQFEATGLPMFLLVRDTRRVVVTRQEVQK